MASSDKCTTMIFSKQAKRCSEVLLCTAFRSEHLPFAKFDCSAVHGNGNDSFHTEPTWSRSRKMFLLAGNTILVQLAYSLKKAAACARDARTTVTTSVTGSIFHDFRKP